MLTGMGTHIALLCYGYFASGGLCPVCLVFASVTALLTAGNFLTKKSVRFCFVFAALTLLTMAGLTWTSSASENQSIPVSDTIMATQASQEPEKQGGATTANEDKCETEEAKNNEPVYEESEASTEDREDRVPEQAEQRIPVQPEKTVTITVQRIDGGKINLDISKKPALLFAPECSACHKVLSYVSSLTDKPYLVSVFYRGEAEKVKEEMAQEGMTGEEFYILLKPPVKGVPALLYCKDGEMEVEIGDTAVEKFLKMHRGA
ncbi:hypothetical protein [Pelotomaculum schinkii]|uniref:hypothetical protein n=1 Tax=Pelotomaculum schinkii TaxID=78350 RepID=UPI00167CF0CC|nr:hypothetical protein [Pelotomaculum schinkii]